MFIITIVPCFSNSKFCILDNECRLFKRLPGEIVALIGPNGAGKTTLFNVISGFIRPDGGKIVFKDKHITHQSSYRIIHRGISRTFQDLRLIRQISVLENVLLSFRNQPGERLWNVFFGWEKSKAVEEANRQEAMKMLEEVGLAGKAGEPAENLSYGQQKLLSIVCCLAAGSDVLLLDEPVAGIAPEMIETILQVNRVFADMTVLENLEIGGFGLGAKDAKERIAEVLEMFGALKGRLRQDAGCLSGGEQQMVALARALVARPKLLMLDEPSLGLSPGLVGDVFEKIVEINHKTGVSVLIVEQKVREVLEICSRVYSVKLGKTAFEGLPGELKNDKAKLTKLFL